MKKGIIGLVLALACVIGLVAQSSVIQKSIAWSAPQQADPFTELYFEAPQTLPNVATAFHVYSFKFVVHNLENKNMHYQYEVYEEENNYKRMIDKNSFSLTSGESRRVPEAFFFDYSLTKAQIVIIASIVEREAKFPQDRPLVASVILNRLNAGLPLQVDATGQYALGYQTDQKSWWKTDLTDADLQVNSPYNTYLNTGLPPAPISNPGLEALKAVINAPQTNYLFYISDKNGNNHYEATADQHDADVKKYGLGN